MQPKVPFSSKLQSLPDFTMKNIAYDRKFIYKYMYVHLKKHLKYNLPLGLGWSLLLGNLINGVCGLTT